MEKSRSRRSCRAAAGQVPPAVPVAEGAARAGAFAAAAAPPAPPVFGDPHAARARPGATSQAPRAPTSRIFRPSREAFFPKSNRRKSRVNCYAPPSFVSHTLTRHAQPRSPHAFCSPAAAGRRRPRAWACPRRSPAHTPPQPRPARPRTRPRRAARGPPRETAAACAQRRGRRRAAAGRSGRSRAARRGRGRRAGRGAARRSGRACWRLRTREERLLTRSRAGGAPRQTCCSHQVVFAP